MLTLQRIAGNAAVARAVETGRHGHGPGCGHKNVEGTSPTAQRAATQHPNGTEPAVQRTTVALGDAATVQRATEDVQDLLTVRYWESTNNFAKLTKAVNNKLKGNAGKKGKGGKKGSNSEGTGSPRMPEKVLNDTIPGLLRELRDMPATGAQLKLFRTMPTEEADAILEWQAEKKDATEDWMRNPPKGKVALAFREDERVGAIPVRGHLGDEQQAGVYYDKGDDKSRASKRTLMFVLKPDAHKLFFSPQYMALSETGTAPTAIRNSDKVEGHKFPRAAGGEGNLPGYIGVKSESHGDLSIVVNNQATRLLFQAFLSEVVEV
ncbi:hypothetical protein [Streptomyces spiralis]|nr:hypothetical protein [Streptomyces spiralis]